MRFGDALHALNAAALVAACGYREPRYAAAQSPQNAALRSAGEQFAQMYTCPVDRVGVDLEPRVATPPPPDVQADPERLALYNQRIALELQTTLIVHVAGCSHEAMYLCVVAGDAVVACTLTQRDKLGVDVFTPTRTVTAVRAGGVGERLGFRVGDVYVALDHQPVDLATAIRAIGDDASPGHVVTVNRGGAQLDISVPNLSSLP